MNTIKAEVAQLIGPVTEDEIRVAMEIATQDIKGNNIYLGLKTRPEEVIQITCRCLQLYRSALE